MALFLLDVGMRRLAWDRWVESAREGTLAATRTSAPDALGSLRAGRASRPQGPTVDADPAAERLRVERERYQRQVAEARARVAAGPGVPNPPPQPAPPSAGPNAPSEADATTQAADPGREESGLLAAKRRARERFKDG
jgi:hypothetical protein